MEYSAYQRKVISAANRLVGEGGLVDYRVTPLDQAGEFLLTPIIDIPRGGRTEFKGLRVTEDRIIGSDKDVVNLLEKTVKEIEAEKRPHEIYMKPN